MVAARAARALIVGFWRAPIMAYQKLNVDTPAAVVYDWLLRTMHGTGGARLAFMLGAVVVCLLVLEVDALLPREPVAVALCWLLLVGLVAETGYAFERSSPNGTSGLPLTLDQSGSSAGSTARSTASASRRWCRTR